MTHETSGRDVPLRAALALSLALALAPVAAGAQGMVDASDPERLARIIGAEGYRAQVETSQTTGNPIIRTAAEGVNFDIFFYGCRDGRACQSIQYAVSLRMDNPPSLARLNEWNSTKTIGQAFIAENGSVRLAQFMPLRGGVSEEAFRSGFDLWRRALAQYITHTGFRS
jgi:hypothetical protein